MSFINKTDVIRAVFLNEDTGKPRSNLLRRMQFDKEIFSVVLSYQGPVVKFYTDDELNRRFPGDIPDNIGGEVLLLFNTTDAIKILDELCTERQKFLEGENLGRKKLLHKKYSI